MAAQGFQNTGEGGQQSVGNPSGLTAGEGGGGTYGPFPGTTPAPAPAGPTPRVPVVREARNVQRANIDRSSLYDPTQATQALGADYLQTRNASNPQPQGSSGAGAVGYDFTPSDERLY
jgi:hypothetical protein